MRTLTPAQLRQFPLLPLVFQNTAAQLVEALGPNDGMVRVECSRMDRAPFTGAAFYGFFEGHHGSVSDPERGFASSYAVDAIRAFCVEGRAPAPPATCSRLRLTQVDAPGRATFLVVEVTTTGAGPLALQVIEERLAPSGDVAGTRGLGAPLRAGDQRVGLFVPAGGGLRRYRLVVYGESGAIAEQDGVLVLAADGAVEPAPQATIAATPLAPATAGAAPAVRVTLSDAGAASDPSLRFRARIDDGPWTDVAATFDTPPLAPGLHRVEALALHAANGARVETEQGLPSAVGLVVEADGSVRTVP